VFHDWFLTTSVIKLQRLIYCECDFIDIGDIYMYIQSLTTVIDRLDLLVI